MVVAVVKATRTSGRQDSGWLPKVGSALRTCLYSSDQLLLLLLLSFVCVHVGTVLISAVFDWCTGQIYVFQCILMKYDIIFA